MTLLCAEIMTPVSVLMPKAEPVTTALPRVLVAESDSASRARLAGALERDYTVTAVESGQAALDALERGGFDLALLDDSLNAAGGLSLLERFRQQPGGADVPVILVSDQADSAHVVRGLRLGACDYITRPFDIEVVRARIAQQISIKKALDERQAIIADLKEAHAVKDEFLRIATHDLKSPLNNIRLAQYYLRDLVGEDPYVVGALDAIEDTVIWMNTLVEDFLDTTMLKDGQAELELDPVPAVETIWTVIEQHSASASRKNISLKTGKTDGCVLADPNRLLQIMGNLVSNAIKYSPHNRSVTLSAELRGDRVRISVADQGPGIPADERAGLFKAFGKLSARPTGGESSSGLGLWIVKQLAELQGGEVGVDCPPGGGSVFWVELPSAGEEFRSRQVH